MTLSILPHVRFTGSLTFPIELSRSPESTWTANRESQVSLQGKQAAWNPAWLLSQPMCYSKPCQLQFGLYFFPVEKFAVRNFQPSLLCSATAAPNGKAKMAQRASHREGAGPWEPWHDSRSAVLDATTQPQMHFRNVRCSLQNYVCLFTLAWPPKQCVCLARDFKGFCTTLQSSDKKFCFLLES